MKKNETEIDLFLSVKQNELIFKKYKPIQMIGKGSFSKVYSCINVLTNEHYAMKVEKRNAKTKYLQSETNTLTLLKNFGIPKVISFGYSKNNTILIETLLGKSLLSKIKETNKGLELIDLCLCAIQILDRIKWIHSKNFIHKDIKPENFLFGLKDPNIIYLIDFGLSKKYRSSKTGRHISPKMTKNFEGSIRYASINSLMGKEYTRRDDLISLGYMLIFLRNLKLPWKDIKSLNKKDYLEVLDSKKSSKIEFLCKNLPKEINLYMKYVNSLRFEQDPDYDYLKSLFQKLLHNLTDNISINFTWLNSQKIPKNKIFKKERKSPKIRLLEKIRNSLNKNKKCDNFDYEENEKNNNIYKNGNNHISLTSYNNPKEKSNNFDLSDVPKISYNIINNKSLNEKENNIQTNNNYIKKSYIKITKNINSNKIYKTNKYVYKLRLVENNNKLLSINNFRNNSIYSSKNQTLCMTNNNSVNNSINDTKNCDRINNTINVTISKTKNNSRIYFNNIINDNKNNNANSYIISNYKKLHIINNPLKDRFNKNTHGYYKNKCDTDNIYKNQILTRRPNNCINLKIWKPDIINKHEINNFHFMKYNN